MVIDIGVHMKPIWLNCQALFSFRFAFFSLRSPIKINSSNNCVAPILKSGGEGTLSHDDALSSIPSVKTSCRVISLRVLTRQGEGPFSLILQNNETVLISMKKYFIASVFNKQKMIYNYNPVTILNYWNIKYYFLNNL